MDYQLNPLGSPLARYSEVAATNRPAPIIDARLDIIELGDEAVRPRRARAVRQSGDVTVTGGNIAKLLERHALD